MKKSKKKMVKRKEDVMEKDMEYYVRVSGQTIVKNVKRRKELTEAIVEEYIKSDKKDICIIASGSSLNAAMMTESFMSKYMN